MTADAEYEGLDAALRRCGASWGAALVHGLMVARMAVSGPAAEAGAIGQVLEGTAPADALRGECAAALKALFDATRQALAECQSEFTPLLPDDAESTERRTRALADWCEGFLHGLVSAGGASGAAVKERLAAEPIADIIRDMLQMTRAVSGDDEDPEGEEEAYAEVVEYLRVAAQLVYEELADLRPSAGP